MSARVLVVGGGVAGLAAAWEASLLGAEVVLVEASGRFGGKLRTERIPWTGPGPVGELVVEHGPDAVVAYRPAALELAREVGLADQIVSVRPGRQVHLRVDARLLPIPEGMGLAAPTRLLPFLRSPVLSWRHKARAALDLVLPRRLGPGDVAVGSVLRERLGDGLVDRMAEPLVGGIYGAGLDELSLDAVLPAIREDEARHRSLLLAGLARGRASRDAPRGAGSPFRSLAAGMGSLPEALVAALRARGVTLVTGDTVRALTPDGTTTLVSYAARSSERVDAVVLAAGAAPSAELLHTCAPVAAEALRSIRHASSTVVTLAYAPTSFEQPPTTHGWLEVGPAPVSGVTVSSAKWPGRAPEGVVLVRAFVPERVGLVAAAPAERLLAAVTEHVGGVLGAGEAPAVHRVVRWHRVMPVYTVGHLDRVRQVDAGLAHRAAWAVTGAALRGVGVPDCIADARAMARRVLGAGPTTGLDSAGDAHPDARPDLPRDFTRAGDTDPVDRRLAHAHGKDRS